MEDSALSTPGNSQLQAVLDERAVINAVRTYETKKNAALEALFAHVGVSNIYTAKRFRSFY